MGDKIRFEIVKKIAETGFKIKDLGNISKIDRDRCGRTGGGEDI